jgi:predicted RNA-binding protein
MCLSTVYQTTADGESSVLCERVCQLSIVGEEVSLVDLLGNNMTVRGVLDNVDLIRNTITIRRQEAG